MALAFGADGYYASTPAELRQNLEKALQQKQKPVLINVSIDPVSARRPQVAHLSVCMQYNYLCVLIGEFMANEDKAVARTSLIIDYVNN